MKILAFLQNQWFRDPERMEEILETRFKGDREAFTKTFLFFGCLTGKRLENALGEELCEEIVWANTSPIMGSESASKFPADLAYMTRIIFKYKPTHIIAFGKLAQEAMRTNRCARAMPTPCKYIEAPHPAARGGNIVKSLSSIRDRLK